MTTETIVIRQRNELASLLVAATDELDRVIVQRDELLAACRDLIAHVESCRQAWESDGSTLDTKMHGLSVCLNNRTGDLIIDAIAKCEVTA